MGKIARPYKIIILVSATLVLFCVHGASYSYAQEQNIIESFGFYSRGIEYYYAGRLEEAKEVLERSLRLDPRNDEALGYLDLINAEIRMGAERRLEYEYEVEEEPEYYYEEVDYELEDLDAEYRYFGSGKEYPEEPRPSEDKIKAISDALNDALYPSQISGEYKMAFGITAEDMIWKRANGDYNERNFRMINNDFPKTNTFDARVYDRFRVEFDTNKDEEGLNFHSNITVDPWSFVGKTEKFTVASNAAPADTIELELKYWSGTRRTINETFFTLGLGNSLDTSELKVTDGKIPAFTASSMQAETGINAFAIPEQDVDFTFQPVRELWFDYNKDDYNLKVFPLGLEDQALSSDDPMGLSNHHIYWQPSPWLDDWIPGEVIEGENPDQFWRGQWSDDLSFFTRDSDLKRLTALRGVSFEGNFFDNTDLSMTVASPKGLWQDYESVTAIPGAVRTKTQLTDQLMIGTIDTFRIGYNDGKTDSYNYTSGLDISYDLSDATNIAGEVAISKSEDDRNSAYETEKKGTAGHIALKKETALGDARIAYTHMDEGFDPGLADYRETRRDTFWGRHIHFKKPLEAKSSGAVKYEDIEPFRIGDGVDVGRKAINFRLDTKDAFTKKMDNLIDYRYVRDSNHKYVEGVFREENTFRFTPDWTSKFLFINHDLPKTKGAIDPIAYDTDTGEFFNNADIEDGKDPSVSTYSIGLEYAPEDWISLFGIYENTNDFTFATGTHPNGLLNNFNFNTETIEGKVYRERWPQLYGQDFFDLPPYERFNIYRTGVSLRPTKDLGIDLDYTKNDFKFAQSIDNNMNHFGATLSYNFTPRLTGFLKYTFSKAYNLYRLNTSGDLNYEDHHNVFMELDYNVTEFGLLTIQFGEGNVVSPVWGATASPFGDFYPTLDTQHILRVYYQGIF
ncbi:hypothetical protein ACFL28_00045 [Candidatus Omnitrophota bacterium]